MAARVEEAAAAQVLAGCQCQQVQRPLHSACQTPRALRLGLCCRCPDTACKAALGPAVLQRILPPPDFERWEQLTLQRTLDTMPGAATGHCIATLRSACSAAASQCLLTHSQVWHLGSVWAQLVAGSTTHVLPPPTPAAAQLPGPLQTRHTARGAAPSAWRMPTAARSAPSASSSSARSATRAGTPVSQLSTSPLAPPTSLRGALPAPWQRHGSATTARDSAMAARPDPWAQPGGPQLIGRGAHSAQSAWRHAPFHQGSKGARLQGSRCTAAILAGQCPGSGPAGARVPCRTVCTSRPPLAPAGRPCRLPAHCRHHLRKRRNQAGHAAAQDGGRGPRRAGGPAQAGAGAAQRGADRGKGAASRLHGRTPGCCLHACPQSEPLSGLVIRSLGIRSLYKYPGFQKRTARTIRTAASGPTCQRRGCLWPSCPRAASSASSCGGRLYRQPGIVATWPRLALPAVVPQKMAKRCPKCGMATQKSEGCNKMACGGCGAFWCAVLRAFATPGQWLRPPRAAAGRQPCLGRP